MTELLLPFESPTPSRSAPRCTMCARPAWWSPKHRRFGTYCGSSNCTNRERVCQVCGIDFMRKEDGAGSKYCSPPCKELGYRPRHSSRRAPMACNWCGVVARFTGRRGGLWPYICTGCLAPISHLITRLKAHRVSHERARLLTESPGCEVCSTDIVTKTRDPDSGKWRAQLVVDHDHSCCPVDSHSCGRCIRGFLCRQCNLAEGLLRSDPQIAMQLSRYLINWQAGAEALPPRKENV